MLKNPKVRAGIFIALAALFVWIYVDSQRGPDYVAEALKQVPAECEVAGVWRDTDWAEALKQFDQTVVLCDTSTYPRVYIVFDNGSTPVVWDLDENHTNELGETFTVSEGGALTVSDDAGVIRTLPPPNR